MKIIEKFTIWLGNVSHPCNYRRAGVYVQMFCGMLWEILRRGRFIAICHFFYNFAKQYNADREFWRRHPNVIRLRTGKQRIAYPVLKEIIHDFGKLLHPKSLW